MGGPAESRCHRRLLDAQGHLGPALVELPGRLLVETKSVSTVEDSIDIKKNQLHEWCFLVAYVGGHRRNFNV